MSRHREILVREHQAVRPAGESDAERHLRETLSSTGRNTDGSLIERMGIRFVEASSTKLIATMPVEGNTQPYGLLHGGASVVLAESLASAGTALHAHPGNRVMGLEVNATHHRAVSTGIVTGVATAIRLGISVASYDVVITDDSERRVCTCRVTCLIKPARR